MDHLSEKMFESLKKELDEFHLMTGEVGINVHDKFISGYFKDRSLMS